MQCYQGNGTPKDIKMASWMQIKSMVQEELLKLPAPQRKAEKKQKRVTVAGRLVTRELLHQAQNKTKSKRTKPTTSPSHICEVVV